MRHRLRRHVEAAIRDFLSPGEELVTEAVLSSNDLGLFKPKRVVTLTSSRVLLLDYLGVVGRHVEPVAECRRNHASASLTNICGVRLLRVDLGSGPVATNRVYFRFGKQADALVRILESESIARPERGVQGPGVTEVAEGQATLEPESIARPERAVQGPGVTEVAEGQATLEPPGGARSSRRDEVFGAITTFAFVVGWPSAVVLFFVHRWSPVFSSNVALDVGRAIVLVGAGFAAMAFAVMGFGPAVGGEHGVTSVGGYLVLLALALVPSIVLALVFYGP